MFWGLNSRLKAPSKSNFLSYQDENHVCDALTVEMSEIKCWMKNLKLSLQVKKVISESSKSRFKRSGSNLMAKKLSKSITATF